MSEPAKPSVYEVLENAIAVMKAVRDPHAAKQSLIPAIHALEAARAALARRDEQFESLTDPDRTAAEQVTELKARVARLEQELELARADAEAAEQSKELEENLHEEERQRLLKLERKAKDLDKLIMEDDDAFSRYMDRAMDVDEKRRGGPPQR